MTTSSTTIISTVSATLTLEGWAEVRPPLADASAIAFSSPELTIRLVVTDTPGGQPAAELTGHRVGDPSTAIWSLSVTDPTEAHLLEVGARRRRLPPARRARSSRPSGGSWLDGGGWRAGLPGPVQMASADGRALIRLRDVEDVPGGWAIDGDGVRADATDNVPGAVLAALATVPRGESEGISYSSPALEAERPEPPEPDTA